MFLDDLPELMWREWFSACEPEESNAGVPLRVLAELYPEVVLFGPIASMVKPAVTQVQKFLTGVAAVIEPLSDEERTGLNNFEFFSFLTLGENGRYKLADMATSVLESFYSDIDFAKSFSLDNSQLWSKLCELDSLNPVPAGLHEEELFHTGVLEMAFCFLISEYCLVAEIASLSNFSSEALEMRSAFLDGGFETSLESFAAAFSGVHG